MAALNGLTGLAVGIAIALFMILSTLLLAHYRRQNRSLKKLVAEDFLTGVGNQRAFWEALGNQVALAQRSGSPLSLILLDIDDFKQINDSYGHPVGDRVLKLFADRIRVTCRGSDQVIRYGGDEFAVICPNTDFEGARRLALRLQRTLHKLQDGCPAITAGFGVAEFERFSTGTDLLQAADQDLIAAKSGARQLKAKTS